MVLVTEDDGAHSSSLSEPTGQDADAIGIALRAAATPISARPGAAANCTDLTAASQRTGSEDWRKTKWKGRFYRAAHDRKFIRLPQQIRGAQKSSVASEFRAKYWKKLFDAGAKRGPGTGGMPG